MKRSEFNSIVAAAIAGFLLYSPVAADEFTDSDLGPIHDLEAFIVRETAEYYSGGIDPSARPVSGVFANEMDVQDIPRSVTMLTTDHMKLLQIDDLRSLSKFGAGTQLINNYGVTGAPIIRGTKGSTLLNGMVRSFNLNEMPLSISSSEALDIVKGPTPPHISPTHVGGFVNLVPKAPFFDKKRGSFEFTAGSFDQYRALFDYGGPFLLGNKPSAYRISITLNREAGYYNRLRNDFESVYAAIKTDLTKGVTANMGFEFFHYKSNENAGWNRPTQNLIDNGQYIIGEPINITDPDFQGTANRDLASYPDGHGWVNGIQDFSALVIPSAIVDEAVANGRISEAARDAMLDLSDPDDIARAYGQALPGTGEPDPAYAASGYLSAKLAELSRNPNDGYRYTQEYFDNGGIVFTAPVKGKQILSDEDDKSEAYNWVGFADLDWFGSTGIYWQNKFLFDALQTEKLSSYGYAIDTEQLVLANRFQGLNHYSWLQGSSLAYGVGLRYTQAEMVQDYFAEPFSRRDISRPDVSDNSTILAGPQIGPDGMNYWSPDIGANVASELFQAGVFTQFDSKLTEKLTLMLSARLEHAWFDASLPDRVQRADQSIRDSVENSGEKNLHSLGAYLTYDLPFGLKVYGAAQDGISLDLTQGGGVYGEDNFAAADLLESGIKFSLLEDRIKGSISVWRWNQSHFNDRDFQSEPLAGKGVEFEATVTLITDRLYLLASAENQRVRRKTALGYRALYLSDQEWALNAGVLNGGVLEYPENNPDLYYPGIPETTYKAHLIWNSPHYQWAISGVYSRANWLNFEHTLKLPSSFLVSVYAGYRIESWEFSGTVENLTNEDYFLGADPLFASNTLVTKGEPIKFSLKVKKSF